MNQSPKPATVGETAAGWEQRLRAHPEVLPQIAVLLDSIELKHADTATAPRCAPPRKRSGWVARQQERLKTNQLDAVLKALAAHGEPPAPTVNELTTGTTPTAQNF